MAAEDALGRQFPPDVYHVHPDEIGFLKSRDYAGTLRDLEFVPGGESDSRVKAIMASAATEGIREPIERRPYGLHDGHHRYVAAKRLGISIPVRDA